VHSFPNLSSDGPSGGPPPPPGAPVRRGVRLTLAEDELTVDPGGAATTSATVRNTGARVEEFRLQVRGPAGTIATLEPPTVSVFPDDEQSVVIRFSPERSSRHPAGRVPFDLFVASAVHRDVWASEPGAVVVLPFDQLDAMLEPEVTRGRRPGRHRVTTVNGGNRSTGVHVRFADRDGELTFDPPESSTPLLPGESEVHEVRVGGPRRWFGRTQTHSFTATVTQPAAGPPGMTRPPIVLNGTRRQIPNFPWWIPTAALAALALIIPLLLWAGQKTVPAVAGEPVLVAEQRIRDAGYEPRVEQIPDDVVPAGHAIKTSPPEGTSHRPDDVTLFVSLGKCLEAECRFPMPNVIGLTEQEAASTLTQAGFVVARVNQVEGTQPAGQVTQSDPPPRTEVTRGTEVVLTVSTGPPMTAAPTSAGDGGTGGTATGGPAALPELVGLSTGDAEKQLTDLKLTARTEEVHTNELPEGEVIATEPRAGTEVAAGEQVTLKVAAPTAVDLVALAPEAKWTSSSQTVTFGGAQTGLGGSAEVVKDADLIDGQQATVLVTEPGNFQITGSFTLPEPLIEGDHVVVDVGHLAGGTGVIQVGISVNGQVIDSVTADENSGVQNITQDLSAHAGETTITITHTAASYGQSAPAAFWKGLRIEGMAS
jgi:beta-lactam-binding protein with PASTA domain